MIDRSYWKVLSKSVYKLTDLLVLNFIETENCNVELCSFTYQYGNIASCELHMRQYCHIIASTTLRDRLWYEVMKLS